jgi:phosphotransferase system HPr (HPr) family protein
MAGIETIVVLTNRAGLHARPARLLVQTAAQFETTVQISNGEKTANARSIIGVLKLGAVRGDMLTLSADGEDAETALQTLKDLILRKFDEEE